MTLMKSSVEFALLYMKLSRFRKASHRGRMYKQFMSSKIEGSNRTDPDSVLN